MAAFHLLLFLLALPSVHSVALGVLTIELRLANINYYNREAIIDTVM